MYSHSLQMLVLKRIAQAISTNIQFDTSSAIDLLKPHTDEAIISVAALMQQTHAEDFDYMPLGMQMELAGHVLSKRFPDIIDNLAEAVQCALFFRANTFSLNDFYILQTTDAPVYIVSLTDILDINNQWSVRQQHSLTQALEDITTLTTHTISYNGKPVQLHDLAAHFEHGDFYKLYETVREQFFKHAKISVSII